MNIEDKIIAIENLIDKGGVEKVLIDASAIKIDPALEFIIMDIHGEGVGRGIGEKGEKGKISLLDLNIGHNGEGDPIDVLGFKGGEIILKDIEHGDTDGDGGKDPRIKDIDDLLEDVA